MDYLISKKVKNIFLAAIDDSYALTNLFVLLFMQFYTEQGVNIADFQKNAKALIATAGSTYTAKKVAQIIEAIEENFSQSEEKDDLAIAYRNLYVDIQNSSWRYKTNTARMNNLRKQFEAELEGWV